MNLLAIDTSTEYMGICLKSPDKGDLYFSARLGLQHAQGLLLWIDRLLEQAELIPADLKAILVNRGPGSFTGLRIGMATAKGMSQALGIPLLSLSALDCYGKSLAYFDGLVVPLIDAKKKRYYTRIYEQGQPICDYLDWGRENIFKHHENSKPMLFTGPAAKRLYESHPQDNIFLDPHWDQSPANLLAICGQEALKINPKGDDLGQGPLYLRKSEAEISLENKKNGQT